jgi:hypothetical protein
MSLSFLRELNIAELNWKETFAPQLALAKEHLSERLQNELNQRIPFAYN